MIGLSLTLDLDQTHVQSLPQTWTRLVFSLSLTSDLDHTRVPSESDLRP